VGDVIGVGVIGLGFMGRTHVAAYERARAEGVACRLVAVSDRDPERLTGCGEDSGNLDSGSADERLFDPDQVATHTDIDALLSDESVDLVSVCTHTDTHVEIATRALRAGKHVLVEKPVALDVAGVESLMRAAEDAGRFCMPAMCMRFWPGWDWLKEAATRGTWGAVVSARFERLGAAPSWGGGFYGDLNRSGGALFDLHVHDVDFVYHLFGKPRGVCSSGTLAHVSSSFDFADVPGLVVAEGGWMTAPGFGFRMRYLVEFERGVADFDLLRDPVLMVHSDAEPEVVPLADWTGYDGEVRHAVDLALGKRIAPIAPLAEAAEVTEMLLKERKSLESGRAECFD
jgi:predicted dehydrogenase